MSQPSIAFVYPIETGPPFTNEPPTEEDRALICEEARHLMEALHIIILAPAQHGALPSARLVKSRWIVLRLLLGYDRDRSLSSFAVECGYTSSFLSKLGKKMSAQLGLRAPWQRVSSRDIYRKRALGVHAGTWKSSDHWQRRLIREAKSKTQKFADPKKAPA